MSTPKPPKFVIQPPKEAVKVTPNAPSPPLELPKIQPSSAPVSLAPIQIVIPAPPVNSIGVPGRIKAIRSRFSSLQKHSNAIAVVLAVAALSLSIIYTFVIAAPTAPSQTIIKETQIVNVPVPGPVGAQGVPGPEFNAETINTLVGLFYTTMNDGLTEFNKTLVRFEIEDANITRLVIAQNAKLDSMDRFVTGDGTNISRLNATTSGMLEHLARLQTTTDASNASVYRLDLTDRQTNATLYVLTSTITTALQKLRNETEVNATVTATHIRNLLILNETIWVAVNKLLANNTYILATVKSIQETLTENAETMTNMQFLITDNDAAINLRLDSITEQTHNMIAEHYEIMTTLVGNLNSTLVSREGLAVALIGVNVTLHEEILSRKAGVTTLSALLTNLTLKQVGDVLAGSSTAATNRLELQAVIDANFLTQKTQLTTQLNTISSLLTSVTALETSLKAQVDKEQEEYAALLLVSGRHTLEIDAAVKKQSDDYLELWTFIDDAKNTLTKTVEDLTQTLVDTTTRLDAKDQNLDAQIASLLNLTLTINNTLTASILAVKATATALADTVSSHWDDYSTFKANINPRMTAVENQADAISDTVTTHWDDYSTFKANINPRMTAVEDQADAIAGTVATQGSLITALTSKENSDVASLLDLIASTNTTLRNSLVESVYNQSLVNANITSIRDSQYWYLYNLIGWPNDTSTICMVYNVTYNCTTFNTTQATTTDCNCTLQAPTSAIYSCLQVGTSCNHTYSTCFNWTQVAVNTSAVGHLWHLNATNVTICVNYTDDHVVPESVYSLVQILNASSRADAATTEQELRDVIATTDETLRGIIAQYAYNQSQVDNNITSIRDSQYWYLHRLIGWPNDTSTICTVYNVTHNCTTFNITEVTSTENCTCNTLPEVTATYQCIESISHYNTSFFDPETNITTNTTHNLTWCTETTLECANWTLVAPNTTSIGHLWLLNMTNYTICVNYSWDHLVPESVYSLINLVNASFVAGDQSLWNAINSLPAISNTFSTLTVTGDTFLQSTLAVGGTSAFTNLLTANGGILVANLTVTGLITANGGVSGTSGVFSTTLGVTGLITANGGVSGTSGAFSTTLSATGLLTANGGLSGTSGLFSTTLGITGLLTANGGVSATSGAFSTTLAVSGSSILTGSVVINDTLSVSGAMTIASTLVASGNISPAAAAVTSLGISGKNWGNIYTNAITGGTNIANINVQSVINWGTGWMGVGVPAFTTRSPGTRIVLNGGTTSSSVDFALGYHTNISWTSVSNAAHEFRWYAGITAVATLYGTGNLVIGPNLYVGGGGTARIMGTSGFAMYLLNDNTGNSLNIGTGSTQLAIVRIMNNAANFVLFDITAAAVTITGSLSVSTTLAVSTTTTLTGLLTANGGVSATSGAFSTTLGVTGLITANGGLSGTSGAFSTTLGVTGLITANGGVSGTSGAFSTTLSATGLITANGGISGTSGVFSTTLGVTGLITANGGVSGTSGLFSTTLGVTGLITANGGISGTSGLFSTTLGVTGLLTVSSISYLVSNGSTQGPIFGVYSPGTRIVLRNTISPTDAGYTIGVDSLSTWFTIATASPARSFQWFGGITLAASLTGAGVFTTVGNAFINGGVLTVSGGVNGQIQGGASLPFYILNGNTGSSLNIGISNTNFVAFNVYKNNALFVVMDASVSLVTITGAVTLSGLLTANGGITVTGDVVPSASMTYDLGSSTNRWGTIFVDVIDSGGASAITSLTTQTTLTSNYHWTMNNRSSSSISSRKWSFAFFTTETGVGNVGADLALTRHADNTGTAIDTPVFLTRSTGRVSIQNGLNLIGTTSTTNNINLLSSGTLTSSGGVAVSITAQQHQTTILYDGNCNLCYGAQFWSSLPLNVPASANLTLATTIWAVAPARTGAGTGTINRVSSGYFLNPTIGTFNTAIWTESLLVGTALNVNVGASNAYIAGTLTTVGVSTFTGSVTANGGVTGTSAAFSTSLTVGTTSILTGALTVSSSITTRVSATNQVHWSLNNDTSLTSPRRWAMGTFNAETGVEGVGSNFFMARYDNAGSFVANVLFIYRSTGAILTYSTLTTGSDIVSGAALYVTTTSTLTGLLTANGGITVASTGILTVSGQTVTTSSGSVNLGTNLLKSVQLNSGATNAYTYQLQASCPLDVQTGATVDQALTINAIAPTRTGSGVASINRAIGIYANQPTVGTKNVAIHTHSLLVGTADMLTTVAGNNAVIMGDLTVGINAVVTGGVLTLGSAAIGASIRAVAGKTMYILNDNTGTNLFIGTANSNLATVNIYKDAAIFVQFNVATSAVTITGSLSVTTTLGVTSTSTFTGAATFSAMVAAQGSTDVTGTKATWIGFDVALDVGNIYASHPGTINKKLVIQKHGLATIVAGSVFVGSEPGAQRGSARLSVRFATAGDSGLQFINTADDHPLIQLMAKTDDDSSLFFDSYLHTDGALYSSHTSVPWRIHKSGGTLLFKSGTTGAGSALTETTRLTLTTVSATFANNVNVLGGTITFGSASADTRIQGTTGKDMYILNDNTGSSLSIGANNWGLNAVSIWKGASNFISFTMSTSVVSLNGSLTVSTTGTFTGLLTTLAGLNTAPTAVGDHWILYAAAGTASGNKRWSWGFVNAESSTQTGLDLYLTRYTNAGNAIDSPLVIRRLDGQVQVGPGGLSTAAIMYPTSTNVADLGTTSLRWRALYGINADFSGTLDVTGVATFSSLTKALNGAALAGPAVTTFSTGTRLVLQEIVASEYGYALGMESNAMWLTVASTAKSFKFYGGSAIAATLTGAGALTLTTGLTATTGTFTGAGVYTSTLNAISTTIIVTGTLAQTGQMNITQSDGSNPTTLSSASFTHPYLTGRFEEVARYLCCQTADSAPGHIGFGGSYQASSPNWPTVVQQGFDIFHQWYSLSGYGGPVWFIPAQAAGLYMVEYKIGWIGGAPYPTYNTKVQTCGNIPVLLRVVNPVTADGTYFYRDIIPIECSGYSVAILFYCSPNSRCLFSSAVLTRLS